ncbi:MAG: outer membrane beta-barrel protein, partial [Planctomycetales bacterium]|nr:outer membrane beta-barrel protein [Planctomycetales bacterium]
MRRNTAFLLLLAWLLGLCLPAAAQDLVDGVDASSVESPYGLGDLGEAWVEPTTIGQLWGCIGGPDALITGWVTQGFTWNPSSPRDGFNGPVTYNDRANEYQFNQLYLSAGRDAVTDGCCYDLAGRVDLLYGTDYSYVTALGLETHQNGTQKWNSETADLGLAMPQLYAEAALPWGNGLNVKAGHFYSILGYETATSTGNFFYSHSYTRQYGEPLTHTGALATYCLSPNCTVQA